MVNYYEFLNLDKEDFITDEIVEEKIKIKEIALWKAKNDNARQVLKTGNNEVNVKELKEEKKQIDEQIKLTSKARTEIGTAAARENYNKLLEEIEKNEEQTVQSNDLEKDVDDIYSTDIMNAKSEEFMELVRRFKENNKNRVNEINEKRQEIQEENSTMEQLKEKHNQNHTKRMEEFSNYQEEFTRIKYGMDLDEKKLSKLAKIINDGKKDLKEREEKFKKQKQNNEREIGDE